MTCMDIIEDIRSRRNLSHTCGALTTNKCETRENDGRYMCVSIRTLLSNTLAGVRQKPCDENYFIGVWPKTLYSDKKGAYYVN